MVLLIKPAACRGASSAGHFLPQAQVQRQSNRSHAARCALLLAAAMLGAAAVPAISRGDEAAEAAPTASLHGWEGLTVKRIAFEGVTAARLAPVSSHLAQSEGKPLLSDSVRRSLRQLYGTGLYDTIEVAATREGDGVALVFRGTPRTFIGTVGVDGATGATMNMQLQRATQLETGTRLTQIKIGRAIEQMRATLKENGYYEPSITPKFTPDATQQLSDIVFRVASGRRARVGKIELSGDAGMTPGEFRHQAHLRSGAYVDRDTVNRALDGVLKSYQRQGRLEAEVKLESATYDATAKVVNYRFTANGGPEVSVAVEGVNLDQGQIRRLIPIFEEGSVDEDLLNEGNRRLRDYYQRLGYFDAKAEHTSHNADASRVTITYTVHLGQRRRVEKVSVDGNHYFSSATLMDLLSVHSADVLDRHGVYSQSMASADVNAIEALYRDNGFEQAKATWETATPKQAAGSHGAAPMVVVFHISEGQQQRVGTVAIEGNRHIAEARLRTLINTTSGQQFSPRSLSEDHDALESEYFSQGFGQAAVTVKQTPSSNDGGKVDVVFHIDEGEQVFVRNVLLTGLHTTRPDTVTRAITVHAGDPLNQSALSETQRNLYSFALFNEVNAAVINPSGNEPEKTVFLQTVEARRWLLNYGAGFEAQTGQPQNNCAGALVAGVKCNPNGKTGVSPRVLIGITRNSIFGREQSATLRGTYGLLEQSVGVEYQIPHFVGDRNFGFTFSGGYANSLDVSTYVASRLEGAVRWTEDFNRPQAWISRANTFVYELDYRRVKVAASSLQVYPGLIEELSTATRVGGPAFTWIRDTRDVPMDAHRGTYTSFQEFLSAKLFGAQTEFNRIDTSNSSYYGFDKNRFVLARNTRYGQIRAFGTGTSGMIPLPERLYAGGAVSLRGFSQNAAGPRDPETGYEIGGAGALINSTELRLPPPTLPWLGNTMSFVLFHDMGNVFTSAGDAWASALRVRQPKSSSCKNPSLNIPADKNPDSTPPGPLASTGPEGECSFNDFSHALGMGLRYHTPVGPIRFDFSYNLNPPVYPVTINYSASPNFLQNPYVGQAPHFNFFFSLGQAF
jgi:outer membrane protein assembly complex protein YaeT